MNSHTLKINRNAELPESLEIGNDYKFVVNGSVTGISKDDNDDGSFTFTYKVGLRDVEVINKTGKTIVSKDTRRQSQKLRSQITIMGLDYDDTMNKIRHFLPEIIDYISKL